MTRAVNIAQSGSNNQTFRNRMINGAMTIAQRGTSFTGINISNSRAYPADRFVVYNGDATSVLSAAQISDAPAGFVNSIRAQVTTINANPSNETYIEQIIEGNNLYGLAYGTASASTVTLSFWVKVSVAGVYNVWMYSESAAKAIGSSFTVSSANTWQFVSLTFVGDTASALASGNGPGIYVRWYLDINTLSFGPQNSTWLGSPNLGNRMVSGSVRFTSTLNATYQITGVQFEAGSAASPFENRLYGTELQLCQRYFARLGSGVTGYVFGTTLGDFGVQFPTAMRATPSVTHLANYSITNPATATYTVTATALSSASTGTNGLMVRCTSSGMSAATCIISSDNNIGFSAEL